jgi:hypothetical protein
MLPAAARSRPLGLLAAPCRLGSVEMVAAFPLTRGRSVFIRSPRGSGAAAAATLGGVVMRLGRLRRGGGEAWVVVVVVGAERAGAPEACRTLPGPSLVPATSLLFGRGSGTSFSSCSSVEGLRLLLRLVCDGLSLLSAANRGAAVTGCLTSSRPLRSPIKPEATVFLPPDRGCSISGCFQQSLLQAGLSVNFLIKTFAFKLRTS